MITPELLAKTPPCFHRQLTFVVPATLHDTSCCRLLLQTKAGKAARGPTHEEVKDFVRRVKQEWVARCDTHRLAATARSPVWSWDNPRIHGSVEDGDWRASGITNKNFTRLPTYSPDMHSPIETSHAVICGKLQKYVDKHRPQAADTLQQYIDKLQRSFAKSLTPAWGVATVKRCFSLTLPEILKAEGRYPIKACR